MARGRKDEPEKAARQRGGVPAHLRVMISSRCSDSVPEDPKRTMTELRRAIKDRLEAAALVDWRPFEVWINEDEPPKPADRTAVEHCIDQAERADIVLALFNGDAGWAAQNGDVGICHLELERALATAPSKVRVVNVGRSAARAPKDLKFQAWLAGRRLWTKQVSGLDEAAAAALAAAVGSLSDLAVAGTRETRRGKFHTGDALAWSRLNYERRGAAMREAAVEALKGREGSRGIGGGAVARIGKHDVFFQVHAIAGPTSEPGARERVGQPFLRDYEVARDAPGLAGPVHLVLCHRGMTESQAARILGFPDAVLVTAPFGVWAADPVHKSQLLFLAQCRDRTATHVAVQRAFEWLEESGEGDLLVARAEARARIAKMLLREMEAGASSERQARGAGAQAAEASRRR